MSLFYRTRLSRALVPLFLGSALSLASARPAPTKTPAPSAPISPLFLLGAGVGGFVLGAALGAAFKKAPIVQAEAPPDLVFDLAPSALAIVDSKERLLSVNPAWHTLLGTQDSDSQAFAPLLHPDDLAPVRIGLLSIFDGETPVYEREARLFRPDGSLVTARISARKQGEKSKPDTILVGLSDVSELAIATRELEGARAAIRSLYDVMAGDKSANLDAKMKSLLSMGCGRLELPIGALSRRTKTEDGRDALETLFVQSPDRRVRPALILPYDDNSSEGRLLGLDLMHTIADWRESPCVASGEGLTYLGAPVEVNGKWFGMLSFASHETGRSGFEANEVELLGLMSQWIGSEIEREEARKELERQQNEVLAANLKLEELATIDPLTEAKNRRAFNEKMEEEWSRATRYGTPLSLVLLDVDKFKSYNDTHGHQAGDTVLKQVALTMMAAIRTTDFFARYGGEEFALILPNTDTQGALVLAERLRARIEGVAWSERPVTASFGVATLHEDMKQPENLTRSADEALYASKNRGRNRVTHAVEIESIEV
ncbi:phytochrome-like protein cph2 [Abditibacteriota bacterium]|nr:phytochrome-like protein cph2 [Abditibacteriota bacterium]